MHGRMRVGVLGPLVVHLDSGPVSPRGQRPRDVLTMLVQRRGHVVSPEIVLDRVWADQARDLTPAAVHTVIARLRRQLGAEVVETLDAGYRLGRGVGVDVDAFEAASRTARASLAGGDLAAAITAYREALAVWRGRRAFEDASDDLVTGDRARLEEARARVCEELAGALLVSAGPAATEEALAIAAEVMAEHPLREGPHRTAMLATFRLGRQADALTIYRELRGRLRTELGIEPSTATAAVHQRILSQDPTLAPESSPDQGSRPVGERPARGGLGRLPVPPTRTVGREREVDEVLALLDDGRRLVTILGPGGVGKSRLLAEVGNRLAAREDRCPEIVYVDLSGLGESGPVEIAEAVSTGSRLRGSAEDPVSGLAEALADAPVLALVDEAEWSAPAVAVVANTLLTRCPQVRLVVTSRVPLDVLGESRLLLAPLPCPPEETEDPQQLRSAPAVRLLEARLRDHAPDLVVGDDDARDLARIARRLDGLPLALELVAGYAASHTIAELLPLVEAPLDVVSDEQGHSPRHRSLRDTLEWSLGRLDPPTRTVLRRLAVFAGPFELAAARAVAGGSLPPAAVESALRVLVRDAVVQRDSSGGRSGRRRIRLRLLRTVRDLGVEELAALGELDSARRRHRDWYAARWCGQPSSDEQLLDVADSYDDYVEALRRALEARDAAGVSSLAITLERHWSHADAIGPAIRWVDRILASGVLHGPDRARVVVMRFGHGLIGDPSGRLGAVEDPDPLIDCEAELADDPPWLAQCLNIQAVRHYVRGAMAASVAVTTRLVEVARAEPGELLLSRALATHAVSLAGLGEHAEAVATATHAWSLLPAEPSSVELLGVATRVGLALTDAGRDAEALHILTSAAERLDRRPGFGPNRHLLINAGWAALGLDEPSEAFSWFARGVDATLGLPPGLFAAEECCGAACALARIGQDDAARALELADEMRRRRGVVLTATQQRLLAEARALVGVDPVDEVASHLSDSELAATMYATIRRAAAR